MLLHRFLWRDSPDEEISEQASPPMFAVAVPCLFTCVCLPLHCRFLESAKKLWLPGNIPWVLALLLVATIVC